MLHILPILCIIMFVFIVELQLKKQIDYLKDDIKELKEKIKNNKRNIFENKDAIQNNKINIEEQSQKIKSLIKDESIK